MCVNCHQPITTEFVRGHYNDVTHLGPFVRAKPKERRLANGLLVKHTQMQDLMAILDPAPSLSLALCATKSVGGPRIITQWRCAQCHRWLLF